MMNNLEAKDFTDKVFNKIKGSENIQDLESIFDELNMLQKNKMDDATYPKIEFSINRDEIQSLIDSKVLDDDLNFTREIISKLTDPITKLLYATAWKNGDLKKIKHIIKGIQENDVDNSEQEDALVFYQFGKYLTKTKGQPIIDQHVIRAFGVYQSNDVTDVEKIRKLETVNKKHKDLISNYIDWLKSDELNSALKSSRDYAYHIDRLLFATGKTIKFKGE